MASPKGENRTLRVRIRGRCILTFSWHLRINVFLLRNYVFNWIGAYLRCGEPEGRKPNAASQNPGSMQFSGFLAFSIFWFPYEKMFIFPIFQIMYFFIPLTLIENCRAYGINTQKIALPKNVIFCHIKATLGRAGLKNTERRNFVDFLNQSFINVRGL